MHPLTFFHRMIASHAGLRRTFRPPKVAFKPLSTTCACLLVILSMVFTAAPGAVEAQQINAPTAVTIFRTIVAHELTHNQHQRYDEYYHPQISSDGSRIAYATFDRPNGHEYLYLGTSMVLTPRC